MISTATIATIDWLGMRLRVPGEWSIVRHNVAERRGRLTFVDRRRQRLMLAWSPCPDAPDWKRMLDDQQALESQNDADAVFERDDHFGWHVLRRISEDTTLVRAARYDRSRQRVIELVMPVRDDQDAGDEGLVLEGFDVLADDEANRFRAFDIDLTPPVDWALTSVEVSLGKVQVVITQDRAELTVRRLSMADTWFRGDAQRWLCKELKDLKVTWTSVLHDGLPASRGDSREAGARIKAVVGRLRDRIDLAWAQPEANAVMHVTLLRPRGMKLDIDAFGIRCLDSLQSSDA